MRVALARPARRAVRSVSADRRRCPGGTGASDSPGRRAGGFVLTCDGDVVGLSNLFAADSGEQSDVRATAITEAAVHIPGLPLVGYERGDDLARARAHGFAPVGALRVWLHQPGQP
ncbi:hypothetical protein ACFHWS_11800 [Micromonospora sp. LOL_013]|uniref:hypothetical protein n=1 Tax=unclassified Micromonospora TaxID=2617518 RepID=UPI003A8C5699